MAKIIVDGETVQVPDNASEDQISAIVQNVRSTPKPTSKLPQVVKSKYDPTKAAPTKGDFVIDSLQQGLTEGLGTLGGIATGVGGLVKDVFTGNARSGTIGESFGKRMAAVHDGYKELGQNELGTQGYEAQSRLGQVMQSGIKAVGDPITLATMGQGALLKTGIAKVAPIVSGVFGNFAAGAGAEAARGEVEAMGGGKTAQVLGSLVGGGGTSMVAGGALKKVVSPVTKAFGINPGLMTKLGFTDPAAIVGNQATKGVNNELSQAAMAYKVKTGNNLSDALDTSYQTQRELGMKTPALTGVDSPELNSIVNRTAGTDATLRETLQNRVNEARGLAEQKVAGNLNLPQAQEKIAGNVPKAVELAPQLQETIARTKAEVDAKTAAFGRATDDVSTAELGAAAAEAVTKQRRAAEGVVKPLYDKAISGAVEHGEKVPAEFIQKEVLPILEKYQFENAFEKNPLLKEAITKLRSAARTSEQSSGVLDAKGNMIQTSTPGAGLEVVQLDSLKKVVNEQLRNLSPDQKAMYRPLMELKDSIFGVKTAEGRAGGMVDAVSPQFSQEFRSADATYNNTVAARFSNETVKQMEAAKFNEEIVGKVTLPNKPTMVADLIAAAGEDGAKLAEAALLKRIKRTADGTVTPQALEQWTAKYREHLDHLPDLKAATGDIREFNNRATASIEQNKMDLKFLTMEAVRKDVNGESVAVGDVLSKSTLGNVGARFSTTDSLVNRTMSDPLFARDLLKQYADRPEFIKAITASTIQKAMEGDNPVTTLTKLMKSNPSLAPAIGAHLNEQGKFLAVLERLKDIKPTGDAFAHIPEDALQAAVGLKKTDVFNVLRSTIASPINKLGTLIVRGGQAKVAEAERNLFKELAKDPEQLSALVRKLETIESPKASDLSKIGAIKYVIDRYQVAKDMASADPAVRKAAAEKMTSGGLDIAKKAAYATMKNMSRGANDALGEYGGKALPAQNAREDVTSPQQQQDDLANQMRAADERYR